MVEEVNDHSRETYVIAEAGVNHNGDPEKAMALLETAAAAGANAIKFQTFKAASLVTDSAGMADYQKANTGKSESQLDMLTRLELTHEDHLRLVKRARELGIDFLSTAFDSDSLVFLTQTIGVTTLKIASGEITNGPFLLEHAAHDLDIILSTGMSTLSDIEVALGIIAFGWQHTDQRLPTADGIKRAYLDAKMQAKLRRKVTLLHCTTEYPTPIHDVNLKAMDTLVAAFGLNVGYSDHTLGIAIPVAAVARGAVMIEKHFTLDRSMPGPDHAASLEPDELTKMVQSIRMVEQCLGDGLKGPCAAEIQIMEAARKSLVAAANIKQGEKFTPANLTIKRPGTGRSPLDYWNLQGRKALRDYKAGDLIVD